VANVAAFEDRWKRNFTMAMTRFSQLCCGAACLEAAQAEISASRIDRRAAIERLHHRRRPVAQHLIDE
jgi:hypothetical protein